MLRVCSNCVHSGVLEEFDQPAQEEAREPLQSADSAVVEEEQREEQDIEAQLTGILEQLSRSEFGQNQQPGGLPSEKGRV